VLTPVLKKIVFIAATLLVLLLPDISFAQADGRKPGLYAIVEGESVPLSFTYGAVSAIGERHLGFEVNYQTYRYKGESSGTAADSTFVLVIDPTRKKASKTMSEYDPFVKRMTPEKIIIIPLEVVHEKQSRMYYPGAEYNGVSVEKNTRIDFEFTKISDNSFEIRTRTLPEGEYGFVFCTRGIDGFDYTGIFGFTIL